MSIERFSLDTSMVMRLVTRDPLPLFRSAVNFLEAQTQPLLLNDLVLAEAYFALQYHYGYPKADAIDALRQFTSHPLLAPTSHARAIFSLPDLATSKPGFVDRLIHGAARESGHLLVTFEKAAAKLPGCLILRAP